MMDLEVDQSMAYQSPVAHQSKFVVRDEVFGTHSVGFHSEAHNDKPTSDLFPEEEFRAAPGKQDESSSSLQSQLQTGSALSRPKDALYGEKGQDDSRERLSSVSSASVSLGLSSAAGSTGWKSPTSASNSAQHQQQPTSPVDLTELRVGLRNDPNECSGSYSGSPPSSSRNTSVGKKPNERAPASTAAAVQGLPIDGDDRTQLDSNGRRCHSAAATATAVRSSSPPFVDGTVDRKYFSAACSVQSCSSSRSTTPTNYQGGSRKLSPIGVQE
jgi:hypothetical protein